MGTDCNGSHCGIGSVLVLFRDGFQTFRLVFGSVRRYCRHDPRGANFGRGQTTLAQNPTLLAVTRTDINQSSSDDGIFVEDDTLYDVTCWANQYRSKTDPNYGRPYNSRDAAFITFGAKGVYPERITKQVEDQWTGDKTTDVVALEVQDNHKFYTGHRLQGVIKRLRHPAEAYRQKAWERNHKRQGIYVKMQGETRTANPDFDNDGNLKAGVQLDFDHVPEGSHPHAGQRLYVDDKEAWYRYDRLPSVSGIDEPPTGVQWNHHDAEYHRTTVWSGNGELYIEHVLETD